MNEDTLRTMNRKQLAVVGALVADAASLGFHWLYDQARIKSLEPTTPEFHIHRVQDYADVPSYFAHAKRTCGQSSHYGEQLRTLLVSLVENEGKYDRFHYETCFVEHFGYGGNYIGYIDHPTRDTLNNLCKVTADDNAKGFHGADDSQLPALSKLPPLVALYASEPNLTEVVDSAVRVTNDNDEAAAYGAFASQLLDVAIQTGDIEEVLEHIRSYKNEFISPVISAVLEKQNLSTIEATALWGMSCELKFGVSSILHNLFTASSYTQSIRTNIYAGGDSCGRSIILGAILGACLKPEDGVPDDWLSRLSDLDDVLEHLEFLKD